MVFLFPGEAKNVCSFSLSEGAKKLLLRLRVRTASFFFVLGGRTAPSSAGRANSSFLLLLEWRSFFWRADFLPAGGRSCLFLP